jgi:Fungal specific transcription factor domain
VAAVEANDIELRHRALFWFTRAKRHGIGNIKKAKTLVMDVWRRADRKAQRATEQRPLESELSDADWREAMRENGMYIMLT